MINEEKDQEGIKRLIKRIQRISIRVFNRFHRELKPFGLTEPQYNVLRILKVRHPQALTRGEILTALIDKNSNVTRLIDKLYKKGLVERVTPENNRRIIQVSLTKEGLGMIKKTKLVVPKIMDEINTLSEEEIETANRILKKL